jgi:hypothetical protein
VAYADDGCREAPTTGALKKENACLKKKVVANQEAVDIIILKEVSQGNLSRARQQ